MNLWLSGIRAMLARHARVWADTWAVRKELEPPRRQPGEREFLPAHLELTETPVSALPRWSARLIILFALTALVWSCVGQLDIMAVAPGKTIPSGYSKTIQALETSSVRAILVKNGQHVRAGEVLMELEGVGSEADHTGSLQALRAAKLSRLRNLALLEAVQNRTPPMLNVNASAGEFEENDLAQAANLVQNQYLTWRTQQEQTQAVLRQHRAEKDSTLAQIRKLEGVLRIETRRTADYGRLLETRAVSGHDYLEQESRLITAENDLKSQRGRLREIEESIRHSQEEERLLTHTLQRDTLDALRQSKELIDRLTAETDRTLQRRQFMTLRAPINGTVQQLSAHTVGGVVMEGQAIMVIAPEKSSLEVEALVANKDIGFVRADQQVVVKVESFPYTRYGYLTGKVKSISLDAVENEQLGLVFAALISLDDDTLIIDGRKVRLGPGMNITAEIKTGKRRVIDYLLSPLRTKTEESLRER